ncbi:peptidoglycan recognition protein [Nocardioides aestuarii]|uniref:Peptidoglycan recognition protein n=1 Tax=Nocardioides aestuarii TaxID=252231 RepID=A0ABW4TK72_9ACTN
MTRGDGVVGGTHRRPLLKLAAGGAALASVGVAARVALHPGDDDGPPSGGGLVLSADDGSDVKSLSVRLGDELLPKQAAGRWESQRLPTSVHSMVGFTWAVGATAPVVRVRSRVDGVWSGWQRVSLLHDVPEDTTRLGTDLVWIGRATGVQVRVDGHRPDDLTLVLLHPAKRAADALLDQQVAARSTTPDAEDTTTARVKRPDLIGRSDWGANERLRSGRPSYNDTLKQVHVHHTVNANDYARGDVPALIRGMYAYHTQSLGWSDIGYNFLVDRFGRTYVGRAGGAGRLVRGAHTLGFNHNSTGISCIGNFETGSPSNAMLSGVAAIAAWKLSIYGGKPREKVTVRSEGSDKYAAGRTVRLPVIDGHRDTNDTACPGTNLYTRLPAIRKRANKLIRAANQTGIEVTRAASLSGTPALGSTVRANPGRWTPSAAVPSYLWFRDGEKIKGSREQVYTVRPADVGHRLTCRVQLSGEGLETVQQVPDELPVTTAQAVLDFETSVNRRVVIVKVEVHAPDHVRPAPTGKVKVTVGERSRTVTLSDDGRAVVKFGRHRKHPKGRFPVVVEYLGASPFTGASATGTVRVG